MTRVAGSDAASSALETAERLIDGGAWGEAVAILTEANRVSRDPAIEARLVTARHGAFEELDRVGPSGLWPPPAEDLFSDVAGIPEIRASELSVASLGAGLQHHGSLLVRGLLDPGVCESIRAEMVRAFDAAAAASAGAPLAETAPSYVPFEAREGYDFGFVERQFFRFGAVLAVEAPRAFFQVVEALRAARVGEVIGEYFGEPPALSAKKTSLRRARPDSPTEWHQDGAFLGAGTHTVNVWTALTPCGVDAPSMDVVAHPCAGIVPTGTDDALYDWSVSGHQAEAVGRGDIIRPCFEPGDALFFNQLTLHRTATSPAMTKDRYAIEAWFFAPSTYPLEQVPIAF